MPKKTGARASILVLAILITMSLGGAAALRFMKVTSADLGTSSPTRPLPSKVEENTPVDQGSATEPARVTLYGVGDNLYHQSVINDGKTASDYEKYYENIASDIKNADIAFVNQETIIGGEKLGISGYPNFNSPNATGEALVNLGFDVVNHASNHIMDKGIAGVQGTLDFWSAYENIAVIGVYDSQQTRDTIEIVEKEGMRFAFLSYTYGLNGYKLPEGKEYTTNLLDLNLMLSDVKRAQTQSDAVVVSIHWGTEYSFVPTAQQKNIAQALADAGVSLILGHHPHVIQPVEWIQGKNGNQMLVYYSLGNLVHSMEVTDCMLGAAAKIEFVRNMDGVVQIEAASVEPLINHYEVGKKGFLVYKLSDYTESLASRHGIQKFDRAMSIANMQSICKKILGEWYGATMQPNTPPASGTTPPPASNSTSPLPTGDTTEDSWKTVLVNPTNMITGEYPVKLTPMGNAQGIPARANMSMDARIAPEFLEMFAAAKKDGINLYLRSSHRTYALQKTYYDSQYASRINAGMSPEQAKAKTLEYTAYPGASEHHTGLALDITSVEWEETVVTLIERFQETKDFEWLSANAHKYGFVLRYPKGKEEITNINYEPWHYRYVGKDAAKSIQEQNLCLEEYVK